MKEVIKFCIENWVWLSPILLEIALRLFPTAKNVSIIDNVWKILNKVVPNIRIENPVKDEIIETVENGIKKKRNRVLLNIARHVLGLPIILFFISIAAHGQIYQNFKGVAFINADSATAIYNANVLNTSYGPAGFLYYNKQSNKFRIYYDSAWHDLIQTSGGGGGAVNFADNGTTLSGDTVELGGTLHKITLIDMDGNDLTFSDIATGANFEVDLTSGSITLNANSGDVNIGSTSGDITTSASTFTESSPAFNINSQSVIANNADQFSIFSSDANGGVIIDNTNDLVAISNGPTQVLGTINGAGADGLKFNDDRGTPTGFEYSADYSATMVGLSIPPKSYVDGHLAGETVAAPLIGQNGQSLRWNNGTQNWDYFTVPAGGDMLLGTAQTSTAKKTFQTDATNAGINITSIAGDPSTPVNGDLWMNSTSNAFSARIAGANTTIARTGGGTATRVPFYLTSSSGQLSDDSGFAFSTTNDVLTVGRLVTLSTTTTPAIGIGSFAGDPSSLTNGDVWYNSTTNKFRGRENGASVNLIGTGSPAGSDTQMQYNNAGAFGAEAALTYNQGTNVMTLDGTQIVGGTVAGAVTVQHTAGSKSLIYGVDGITNGTSGNAIVILNNTTNGDITLSPGSTSGDVVVNTGIDNNGSGLKHARVTTGSVPATSSALVTITWGLPFANANYTVNASVVEATTSNVSLRIVHIETVASGSITVRVYNESAGALTGTIHAIAIHD